MWVTKFISIMTLYHITAIMVSFMKIRFSEFAFHFQKYEISDSRHFQKLAIQTLPVIRYLWCLPVR